MNPREKNAMTSEIVVSDSFKSTILAGEMHQYLLAKIADPLIFALANVNVYRPDDPIEFIAKCLIDWSYKNVRQKLIEDETYRILTDIEIYREQCLIDRERKQEVKQLKLTRKEQLRQDIALEYDKHLFESNKWNFYVDPRTDDEREPFRHFQSSPPPEQQQQQFHGVRGQHLHMHETASGSDNQTIRSMCNETLPLSSYFSKLKDKLIKCDDVE